MSEAKVKKETILNTLFECRIDKINIVGAYENENFYKIRIFRCNHFGIRMCYSKIEIARVYCKF